MRLIQSFPLLLFVLFFQNNYSQELIKELKAYKGEYNGGNAEYQYYESAEYERILNGNFKYSRKNKINEDETFVSSETGTFIDNKKNGEWTFKISDFSKLLKREYNLIIIKGNYKNDLKSGVWSYSIFEIINNVNPPKTKLKFTGNPMFLNDTIVGKVDYPRIKGEVDNKGNLIGEWHYHKLDREITASFRENILVKYLDREFSTGQIYAKYMPNLDLVSFHESINKYEKVFFKPNEYHVDGDEEDNNNLLNIGGLPLYDENKNDYRFGINNSLSLLLKTFEEANTVFTKVDYGFGLSFQYLEKKAILKRPEILIIKK